MTFDPDQNFVSSVAERDIDFLMLEELSCSEAFRSWFASLTFGTPTYGEPLGAWHSVSESNLGESDLMFLMATPDGERIAFLIENKINAPAQEQQAERYRLRGKKGVSDGHWEDFQTCIIAPRRYLTAVTDAQDYDCAIAYEQILAFFASRKSTDPRFAYRANIVQEAIEQNRRGHRSEVDPVMTQFVDDYWAAFHEEFAELKMQKPKPRARGHDWIVFTPTGFPDDMRIIHQLLSGKIKLYFDGMADELEQVSDKYAPYLPNQTRIEPAGKSASIVIQGPAADPFSMTFSEQAESMAECIQAARRLYEHALAVEGL